MRYQVNRGGIIRGAALFAAGALAGIIGMQLGGIQLNAASGDKILALSHVGLAVKNFDEARNYYTKTLGFKEAFSVKNTDGSPFLTYIQINKNTFIELQPSNANQAPGFTHFGLEVENLNATIARLRGQGLKVEDSRMGRANAPITNTLDPNGVRIELLELTPESMHRKAINSWR